MLISGLFFVAAMVASMLLIDLLTPKPNVENARPSNLGDFRFPTATQGRAVPIIWGTVLLDGPNVTWYGDFRQVPITQSIKTGLFKKKRIVTGYAYYFGMQFCLCRGEIDAILGIWVKEKQVFSGSQASGAIAINEPGLFGGNDLGYGGLSGTFRLHPGSSSQAANSYLSDFQDVSGTTPTYPGTCYLVFEGGYWGNTTSIDAPKFEVQRIPNGLGLGTASVNTYDANPMNVIYELMTDTEWGLALPAADIDTTTFTAAATTLASEGNGWSFVLDQPRSALDILDELQRQIDGMVYLDRATGKWKVKLARDDYDIDLVPEITESNTIDVGEFSRGSWDDTSNQVRVGFANRTLEYSDDFALAQDMANAMLQGGGSVDTAVSVSTQISFPGCKDATLANQLAWRELRALSYPLARASVTVDRSFWDVSPGDVLAWTDTDRGFSKLPMRVISINYGDLLDGKIELTLVQDVFKQSAGIYGDPPDTSWEPPDDDLDAFPSDEQLAIEAPRGFCYRDPERTGDVQDKIWCSGRAQSNEVGFHIRERHASGTPSGDFSEVGSVYGLMKIGSLKSALASGTAVPTSSILIEADPDTQADLQEAFTDSPDLGDQGVNLINLILIDNEFMLVQSASDSGADVSLNNVYRGVLDGGQAAHAAGASVYLLHAGGGMIDTTIPDGQTVHVKLLPFSAFDTVDEGDATQIALTMDDRLIRPYPPAAMELNGTKFNSGTVSLDYLASGAAETTGIDLDFYRRDYLVADGGDEIDALSGDDSGVDATTDHDAEIWNDPDGSPTLLFTEANISGSSQDVLRIKILKETDGVVPSRMRIVLKARHDAGGKTGLLSRNNLVFDFDVGSSALSGKTNFGALDNSDTSNVYTADAAGQHDFTLSSSFTAGNVEYRLNGGSWTTLITAGGTTGNIAAVSVSDTIEIRHLSTDTDALKQIDMSAPGAGTDAYGILFT
jgi:hypothetical protein